MSTLDKVHLLLSTLRRGREPHLARRSYASNRTA